jgi:hypothetical protein
MYGAKSVGATHMLFATDAAFYRWLVHFGLPLRLVGPEADYYGRVALYTMSLAELDQVILSQEFHVLDGFPVGPAQNSDPGWCSFNASRALGLTVR